MIQRLIGLFALGVLLSACANLEEKPHPHQAYLTSLPEAEVKVDWYTRIAEYGIDRFSRLSPVVAGDSVYVADKKGTVQRRSPDLGEPVWESQWNLNFSAGPEVVQGQVLLGTQNADLLALNAEDGKLIWRTKVSSEVITPPKRVADIVIVQTIDGRVVGLDAGNGKQVWTFSRQVPILTLRGNSPPLIVDDRVIIGLSSGKLVALSVADGKMLWESSVAIPRGRSELERVVDIDGMLLHDNGTLYVVSYQGRIAAVTIESGRILWTRDMSSYFGLSMSERYLFVSDADGKLWALDKENGATLWMQDKLQGLLNTTATIAGDRLVVGDIDGNLYWIMMADGGIASKYAHASLAAAVGFYSVADTEEEQAKYKKSAGYFDFGLVTAPQLAKNDFVVTYRSGIVAKLSLHQ